MHLQATELPCGSNNIPTNLEQQFTSDPTYQLLVQTIEKGFPSTQQQLDPTIRDYWDTKDRLTVVGNIVLMDSCIVVPTSMRKHVLSTLYAAHQGVMTMRSRANKQYLLAWAKQGH